MRERPRAGERERDCEGETKSGRERETQGCGNRGAVAVLKHPLFFSVGNCKLKYIYRKI